MKTDAKDLAGFAIAAAILGGVIWMGLSSSEEEEPMILTLEQQYLLDGRLDALIYNCPFTRPYDEQLADVIPLLVSKLEHGTKEPLRQFKQELGVHGGRAVPELVRRWEAVVGGADAKWKQGVLENLLQAANLMDDPAALDVLRRGIQAGVPSVRMAALPGLAKLGDEGDYESVAVWLPTVIEGEIKSRYSEALFRLDPYRFYEDVAVWMSQGQHESLWPYLLLDILKCRDEDQARMFKDIAPLRDEQYVPFLMAPSAALGDLDAMEELMTRLGSERPGVRQYAVQALAGIGETAAVAPLISDDHAGVRRLVVTALKDDPSEVATEYLREAVNDPSEQVRKTAIIELVRRGHELTVAEALALLEGHIGERELGINALRSGWDVNTGSAEDALLRLLRVWKEQPDDAGARISVLQALAHVPLEESASFLYDFGLQYKGEVKGQTAHRWACGQVWNTGTIGRTLLRTRLAEETDPFRRLDLIEFIWQDHEVVSRNLLLDVLRDETQTHYERLYVADRLTRMGPAELVAPAIKRYYFACTDFHVRPALQCLLWVWYGQHDFQ
ncbi:MAG: HEAT repeat domain-containing protein [Planctomycetota bacterium]|nr:HEAT repeat domain-containing protein [Planctomycetota bacterium]